MALMQPNDPRLLMMQEEKRRLERLDDLEHAFLPLYEFMHKVDGTAIPGEHQGHHWSSDRITTAAMYIETARLFIEKHVEEMR